MVRRGAERRGAAWNGTAGTAWYGKLWQGQHWLGKRKFNSLSELAAVFAAIEEIQEKRSA